MEAAFTNFIQNIKTNPAWLFFVQDFKAYPKISRKMGFFVALFVGLSKQKYFAEKEQGFSKFITMVCKESCQLQESRGSQDSVTPHGLPSDGCPASPTLAVSRPINFVEVAGPSSLLNSNTTFGLPAEQHETWDHWELSLCPISESWSPGRLLPGLLGTHSGTNC